jgi:hypothetical protein
VKGEERVVHFLDDKQTVRQVDWEHIYSEACGACSLRTICGGLFDRGGGYDPRELAPVFISRDAVVKRILEDPADPSATRLTLEEWRVQFDQRRESAASAEDRPGPLPPRDPSAPAVGFVTVDSLRRFEKERNAGAKRAERTQVEQERAPERLPPPTKP